MALPCNLAIHPSLFTYFIYGNYYINFKSSLCYPCWKLITSLAYTVEVKIKLSCALTEHNAMKA
jgi:hypothetical protein